MLRCEPRVIRVKAMSKHLCEVEPDDAEAHGNFFGEISGSRRLDHRVPAFEAHLSAWTTEKKNAQALMCSAKEWRDLEDQIQDSS